MRTHSGSFYDKRASRNANGTYSGTRAEWLLAYREARINKNNGAEANPEHSGIAWKADLIIQFERDSRDGILTTPAQNKMLFSIIDEIMAEILAEEAAE